MSWSSGTEIAQTLITSLMLNVKDKNVRRKIYEDLIRAFENADCDTMHECKGDDIIFDEAYDWIHEDDEDI